MPEDGDVPLRDADGNETAIPKPRVVASISAAFSTAIDAKRRDSQALNKLHAPITQLSDAARLIDRARTAFAEAVQHDDFDVDEFDEAVGRVRRAFDELLLERNRQ